MYGTHRLFGEFFVYMAAANTDKFKKTAPRKSTTLSGSVTDSDVTLACTSLTNWPTDTAVDVVLNRVDSNGDVQATWETVTAVVSGNNLTTVTRGVEGTASAWPAGTVVELLWASTTWEDAVDGIVVEHNQDGSHKKVTGMNNDTFVTANNNAGTAEVNILKVNTSDQIEIGANVNYGNFFFKNNTAARAYKNTNQTTVAAGDKISFQAESFDLGSNFDSSTNYRYVAPISGYYYMNAILRISNPTDQDRYGVTIKLNGATNILLSSWGASGTSAQSFGGSCVYYMAASDYVEVYAAFGAGTPTVSSGETSTFFEVMLVSV